jgi:hypothetical protein
VMKCETASASEESLAKAQEALLAEGSRLESVLRAHPVGNSYPATLNCLLRTVRILLGPRSSESWDSLKRDVEEASPVSGREFCLWMIKDLRRTEGRARPELILALKAHKNAQGVDSWGERVKKASLSDLSGLEAEIRDNKVRSPK